MLILARGDASKAFQYLYRDIACMIMGERKPSC